MAAFSNTIIPMLLFCIKMGKKVRHWKWHVNLWNWPIVKTEVMLRC